jgi:hypothetical protein
MRGNCLVATKLQPMHTASAPKLSERKGGWSLAAGIASWRLIPVHGTAAKRPDSGYVQSLRREMSALMVTVAHVNVLRPSNFFCGS